MLANLTDRPALRSRKPSELAAVPRGWARKLGITRERDLMAGTDLGKEEEVHDRRMTSSLSRRRLLGHAVAAAGMGALLAPGIASGTAAALSSPAPAPTPAELPEIGQTIRLGLNGFGATLRVNAPPPLPTLNFVGSRTVKVLAGGTDFVRLRTLNFTMRAFHPMFGSITLRDPDIDIAPTSTLELGPQGLVETWFQSMTVSFDRCQALEGPFTFETLEPGKWVAHHTAFPPPPQRTNPDGSPTGGTLYKAQRPVSYGRPATSNPSAPHCPLSHPLPEPDGTYFQLPEFNINQGVLLA